MKKISIDPVTRLEGHGRIDIFLNDEGEVANAYMVIPELRGFEKFAQGRRVEELTDITPRSAASVRRRTIWPRRKPATRSSMSTPRPRQEAAGTLLLGLLRGRPHGPFLHPGRTGFRHGAGCPGGRTQYPGRDPQVGVETGTKVIQARGKAMDIIGMLGGGKSTPPSGSPAGWARRSRKRSGSRWRPRPRGDRIRPLTLQLFRDIVLKNQGYMDLILSEGFTLPTYYMGHGGLEKPGQFLRRPDPGCGPGGERVRQIPPQRLPRVVAERVEPWTYLKFPYLKKVGWKGLTPGKDNGIYQATPLSRLNAADGMARPAAQEAYEEMYKTFGKNRYPTSWRPTGAPD